MIVFNSQEKGKTMNYSEIKSNAAQIATLETAIAEGYRALQSKLKDFQEKKIVYLQVKLNSSFAVLKTETERIIESYRPISEAQDATETVKQKTDEENLTVNTPTEEQKIEQVMASIPAGTITDNNYFLNSRLVSQTITGTPDEKMWLEKRQKDEAKLTFMESKSAVITFVKSDCARYYEAFAGDSLRSIALLGTDIEVKNGVLKTQVKAVDARRLRDKAKELGLTLVLHERYVSDSHESLKAEAKRIIESLNPIAKTQDAANTHITNSPYDDAIDAAYYEGNRKDA